MSRIKEITRVVTAWLLAVVMLIPAFVIAMADRVTRFVIHRRGGLD